MTSSIVITDTYKLDFDKKNKFYYIDENVNTTYEFQKEEIPVVRYRFNHYGINELNYIKDSLKKFDYSVHIAEVKLDADSVSEIKLLSSLKEVAIFVYIDLYKDNIVNKSFSEAQRNILNPLKDSVLDKVERFMLKDVDNVLHMLVARPLLKSISSYLGVKEDKVGYCSCAFSTNGLCCLTAERARDIAARYSNNEHFAIATNAVEGKNIEYQRGCNCIRYILINHDMNILSDEDKKSNKSSRVKKQKENKSSKEVSPFDGDYEVDGQLKYDGEKIVEENFINKPVSDEKEVEEPKLTSEDVESFFEETVSDTNNSLGDVVVNTQMKKDKVANSLSTDKKTKSNNASKKKLKVPKKAIKF